MGLSLSTEKDKTPHRELNLKDGKKSGGGQVHRLLLHHPPQAQLCPEPIGGGRAGRAPLLPARLAVDSC